MIIYSGDANRPYVVPTPQTDPDGPKLVLVIAPQDSPAREGTEMVLTTGSRVKPLVTHGQFVPVTNTGVRRQDDFASINSPKVNLVKPTNQPQVNAPGEYTIPQPQQEDNANQRIDQQAISETLTAPYPYEVTTPGYNLVYQYENDDDIVNSKIEDDFKPSDADILSNSIPDNNGQNDVRKTFKVQDIQLTERMDARQTKVRPYPPPRPTVPPPLFTTEQVKILIFFHSILV